MVLLDTDTASYLIKGDDRAATLLPYLEGRQPALSFMSVAELYQWAEIRHWGERRRAMLEELLESRYVLLGYEPGLAREWARVRAECRDRGRAISVPDAWIAASARFFGLPLLSNNQRHFEAVAGITLLPD